MLISPEYAKQQKAMHDKYDYGTMGATCAPFVADLLNATKAESLLDYGAGKMGLIEALHQTRLVSHAFRYAAYEPSNPDLSETPEPAELVVCIDVLEHVEPEFLDNVLDDLKRLTMKAGFFNVCKVPAKKCLPDGRNAHLIQQKPRWWLPKIMDRFELVQFIDGPKNFNVVVKPMESLIVL